MYTYDLHTHSRASHDCKTSYRDLIVMTRRRGLSGIALTDHDTVEGYFELADVWPHAELHLIPGCERTLADGSHVIGLFLTQCLRSTSIRDLIAEIREQQGLVYIPHPYRDYSGILGSASGLSREDQEWAIRNSDLIEIYNRKCTAEENRRALDLAELHGKVCAAGSDSHLKHEIGYGCTSFRQKVSSSYFQSEECYGLSEEVARQETAHRDKKGEAVDKFALLRKGLKSLGLIKPARRLRQNLRSLSRPSLIRYR